MTDSADKHLWIKAKALENGFDSCHLTAAQLPEITAERLNDFIAAGYHGEMGWLDETKTRRASPDVMWDEACSAIILGVNYGPDHNPLDNLDKLSSGETICWANCGALWRTGKSLC